MPDWNLVTRAHVLAAIQECDRVGSRDFLQRYKFGRAGSSSLWHGGQEYDSNAILGVAYLRASGLAPTKDDFSGGQDGAAKVLLDLGFDVVVTEDDPVTATKPAARSAAKSAAQVGRQGARPAQGRVRPDPAHHPRARREALPHLLHGAAGHGRLRLLRLRGALRMFEQLGTPEDPSFGLDTFGDRGTDAGRPHRLARRGDPAGGRGGRARRPARPRLHRRSASTTATTSRSRPPTWCSPPSPAAPSSIRLGTSVTVLSSDDPVRVFERFSTLDALSRRPGRGDRSAAGSFTESFPLFGLRLEDYEVLFAEKLDLFAAAAQARSRSPGRAAPGCRWQDQRVYPPTESGRLPAWVGVGGTPQSVVRAAHYGMPLVLAVIGGSPASSRRWSTSTTGRSPSSATRAAAGQHAQPRPRRGDRRARRRAACTRTSATRSPRSAASVAGRRTRGRRSTR